MPTTYVSGMSTDIGIGLARMIDMLRSKEGAAGREAIMTRMRLPIGSVFSFLPGSVIGVLTWHIVGDLGIAFGWLVLGVVVPSSIGNSTPILA